MKDFLAYVAKALVDQPDMVAVHEAQSAGVLNFELRVAPQDMGKIIGKQGRTIQALRTLISAAAAQSGKRATLEVPEDL